MIEQTVTFRSDGSLPRHFEETFYGLEELIDADQFHLWIARAILSQPAILSPMVIESEETRENNLELVFLNLDSDRQNKFRAAITRVVQDKQYWPPKSLSESEGLCDIVRLVRLSAHHELSGWIGVQVANLAIRGKSPPESLAFNLTIANMVDIGKWAPQSGKDGSNYRIILDQLRIMREPRTHDSELIGAERPTNITRVLAALRAGLT